MTEFPTWIPVVAVALQDGRGRWLMHRRPPGKHHAGLWEFPGGKVEADEIPVLALIREAREELGIDLSRDHLRPIAFADNGVTQSGVPIVILLYTARNWQGEPEALEGGQVGWFTAQEMAALDKPPLDCVLAQQLIAQIGQ